MIYWLKYGKYFDFIIFMFINIKLKGLVLKKFITNMCSITGRNSMKDVTKAKKIVESHGGQFVRKTKHGYLYKFRNSARILISGTPSSTGWVNDLTKELKKLGVTAWFSIIGLERIYFFQPYSKLELCTSEKYKHYFS